MFRKTKNKLIAVIMLALLFVFSGMLALIYGSSYAEVSRDNQQMLERYAQMYMLEEGQTMDPPPPEDDHRFNMSTFYSVAIAENGTVLKITNQEGNLYTDDLLKKYAMEIYTGKKDRGTVENLAYLRTGKGDYTLVAFIDNSVLQGSMATLFRNTLLFGGISIVAIFAAACFMTNRIVAPLEENDRKQRRFISDAGHELKTPVSVISANAEILEKKTGQNQWLSNIRYENERMGLLVKQLLELTRAENATVQTDVLDYSRLVAGEALPFESVAFEHGLRLECEIAQAIHVNGNDGQLRQLVAILIDNAIRYSKNGKSVELGLCKEHGWAKLSVANMGDAITEEQKKQIFERFYRVDEARNSGDGHFGLGLAIAKTIVTAHKGKIDVQSHDGKVEFIVLLPIQKNDKI